jgi:hypothetical protein
MCTRTLSRSSCSQQSLKFEQGCCRWSGAGNLRLWGPEPRNAGDKRERPVVSASTVCNDHGPSGLDSLAKVGARRACIVQGAALWRPGSATSVSRRRRHRRPDVRPQHAGLDLDGCLQRPVWSSHHGSLPRPRPTGQECSRAGLVDQTGEPYVKPDQRASDPDPRSSPAI